MSNTRSAFILHEELTEFALRCSHWLQNNKSWSLSGMQNDKFGNKCK